MKSILKLALILMLLTSVGSVGVITAQSDCAYQESPMLTEQVDAGTLPPICDRLPEDPFVFEGGLTLPLEIINPEIGQFGGEMILPLIMDTVMKENLFTNQNRAPAIVAGNIIKSLDVSDDYSTYTFHLRTGHKWSDGAPMTTEDVRFAFEDVLFNPLLYANPPSYLMTGGVPSGEKPQLDIVDETTFTLTYPRPYPAFTYNLTQLGIGYLDIIKPEHFLARYHIDYGDADEIASMVADAHLDEWYELFNQIDLRGWNEGRSLAAVGFPQLGAWIQVAGPEDRITMERNPYYFAVDPAGNQLPYIDRIVELIGIQPDTQELMMYSGQVDYYITTNLSKLPLFIQNEEGGNYKTIIYPNRDSRMFDLNLTYDDPTWREVVWDVRFRTAIDLAIDKQELLDELYFGQGKLPTTVPADYDPDEANRLLDEMGMTERDANGFRLSPSGEPFSIMIEVGTNATGYKEQAPFLVDYFKAVGVNTDFREVDDTLLNERLAANEVQGRIIWNTAPYWASHAASPDYLPSNNWGPLWYQWYTTNGASGEEPPQWIKDYYAIHENLVQYPYGSDEFYEAAKVRDEWIYENIPFFTFIENPGILHAFSNCVGNVPQGQAYHHGTWPSWRLMYMQAGCE